MSIAPAIAAPTAPPTLANTDLIDIIVALCLGTWSRARQLKAVKVAAPNHT